MNHSLQSKLLELSQRYDLSQMGLREIGRLVGEEHPQKIKFHLRKIGLLGTGKRPRPKKNNRVTIPLSQNKKIISIPILGAANCGEATTIAEARLDGILPVSRKLIPAPYRDRELFAVKASGKSMNRANLDGKNIEDGDFVIVDREEIDVKNGDYILSIIGGLANIKKYFEDKEHDQIVLESESTSFFPPIHIHREDIDNYFLNGKVVSVIKARKKVEEEYSVEPIPSWDNY